MIKTAEVYYFLNTTPFIFEFKSMAQPTPKFFLPSQLAQTKIKCLLCIHFQNCKNLNTMLGNLDNEVIFKAVLKN